MLVRTKQASHFTALSLSGGTDDRPGHPRTSGTLVPTKQASHFKAISLSKGTDDRPWSS